jgi:hypothetical protein
VIVAAVVPSYTLSAALKLPLTAFGSTTSVGAGLCDALLLASKPVAPLYAACTVYVPAFTPAKENAALADPLETVPDVAVPIVVAPLLTVNATVPAPTAGPLAGVTEAVRETEVSP